MASAAYVAAVLLLLPWVLLLLVLLLPLLLRQLAVAEMKFPFNCCNRRLVPHMLHIPRAVGQRKAGQNKHDYN